jgi:hypothetical protein
MHKYAYIMHICQAVFKCRSDNGRAGPGAMHAPGCANASSCEWDVVSLLPNKSTKQDVPYLPRPVLGTASATDPWALQDELRALFNDRPFAGLLILKLDMVDERDSPLGIG